MENEEIRKEVEKAYTQIISAERKLEELRDICKHENSYIGEYSYRVGASSLAVICKTCGKLLKYI